MSEILETKALTSYLATRPEDRHVSIWQRPDVDLTFRNVMFMMIKECMG